jgi:O-antigen ligase
MAIQNPTFLRSDIEDTTYVRLEFRNLSNFGNPNFLALLMVLLIFVGLGFAVSGQRKLFALPTLAAVTGYFYVFLKCQSRGATLALAAGLIVFWFTQKHKALILVLGTILLGVGFTFFAPKTFLTRLNSITDYSADASSTGRLQLWGAALQTIESHPLTGVGPGNFAYRVAFNSQHETYLQAASELGVFGLILLLALYVSSIHSIFVARSMLKSHQHDWRLLRSFGGSLYACLTALFVQGFFTGFAYREFFITMIASGYLCRVIAEEAMAGERKKVPDVPLPGILPGSAIAPGWGAPRLGNRHGASTATRLPGPS